MPARAEEESGGETGRVDKTGGFFPLLSLSYFLAQTLFYIISFLILCSCFVFSILF